MIMEALQSRIDVEREHLLTYCSYDSFEQPWTVDRIINFGKIVGKRFAKNFQNPLYQGSDFNWDKLPDMAHGHADANLWTGFCGRLPTVMERRLAGEAAAATVRAELAGLNIASQTSGQNLSPDM